MENICGYDVDLSKGVYLIHPSNKFWEVVMTGLNVAYRVGKLRGGEEIG